MQVTHLLSSNLDSAAWHRGRLIIKFNNGSVYSYEDVPLKIYKDLINAESHGKFFNKNIRMSYPYHKVISSHKE